MRQKGFSLFKVPGGGSPVKGVLAAAAVTFAIASPLAAPVPVFGATYSGELKTVESATVSKDADYVVDITFNDGVQGKVTFLDEDIFRYNVDPSGEFSAYAAPRSKSHTAKIPAQPDTSDSYEHPKATVTETDAAYEIHAGNVTVVLDKATAKLSVKAGDKTVMQEASPLDIQAKTTVQKLEKGSGENFFGGGTQNGRFIHTGESIQITNNNVYVDGGVSSPNPFYWTSDGYGVLRNTFSEGAYDFGKTDGSTVTAQHNEGEFDAYYFVTESEGYSKVAQDLLQDYYEVTGDPVLLPEYAFYVGHYNAYNRDMWSDTAKSGYSKWHIAGHDAYSDPNGGTDRYEHGGTGTVMEPNSLVETLNGHGPTEQTENIPEGVTFDRQFSAQGILDEYQDMDMPLGYFLPNDGYGAGYGQNGYNKTGGVNADGSSSEERLAAVKANVENLKEFSDYANSKGVATGLWTQSNLSPDSNKDTLWHTLRDFDAEVKTGGVTTLKTDVAWVGSGYSFGLNGTKTAYDIVTTKNGDGTGARPNIVTLDGWAGSQRFAGVWTGDQTGGNWEYIRFHIPTFVGQGLAGNPNIGSDMDGIWGGHPIVATRDYQWKSFGGLMLDMDGWGSYAKMPYSYGDPYTGINRMYLKLKSSLLPYIYTTAASAANQDTGNGDAGLPIMRAILLSDDSAYAASTATQYEYTLGADILVAPIYQNTDGDAANKGLGDGDDVRDNIYLPGTENDIWIDYWTGDQYRGGQVLNNFEAPLWKLPVFVKANAIIPMYKPNDNPQDIDRTQRDVEFFAIDGENSYTQYEDDGTYVENKTDTSDKEYGTSSEISYGDHVSTTYTSKVEGGSATFTAEKSEGSYSGYEAERTTTFVVNVSAEPSEVTAKNGDSALTLKKVADKAAFDAATPAAGEAVYLYDESPNLNYNATAESEAVRGEEFSKTEIATTPKLYVKFAKTDVQANKQTLTVKGFENDGQLPAIGLNKELATPADLAAAEETKTPTSIKLTWGAVAGATSYELKVDGLLFTVGYATEYNHTDLAYNSTHTYQVRARNAQGYSEWSEELTTKSLEDPWRNVPTPVDIDWEGDLYGNHKADLAFDHFYQSGDGGFHSSGNSIGQKLTVDYGANYKFTTLEYHPRDDRGNGTLTKVGISTSLDGVHWTEQQEYSRERSAETWVIPLNVTARYVRMVPLASVGNFFSASEIAIYKQDGTTASATGAINGDAEVGDAAYQHLKGNCLGREDRANEAEQFQTHVAKNGADFNLNGAFDAYDMAFTLSVLDGGTKKTDKVSGEIAVIPSKSEVEAGDVITVDVIASDAKNVNVLGALVHFDSDQFEYVDGSIKQSAAISGMENLSVAKVAFADGTQSINLAFGNKGDKKLYSGSGSVASFQLRAKADGDVALPSSAWLVGATCDYVEAVNDGNIKVPETPKPTQVEYGQDAFDITMTNDELTTDDGSNLSKLIEQGGYDALFDGDEKSNGFEFKWDVESNYVDGVLPSYVKLPTTLTFAFKTPSLLDNVEVLNREAGNGHVTSMDAVITFEDGSKQEFSFDNGPSVYTLAVDEAHAGKKATSVAITPKTSDGSAQTGEKSNRMLTLREINFNYVTAVPVVDSVELGDNATELYVDDVAKVDASILPSTTDYPYFRVESSDESIASTVAVQSGEDVVNYVRANKPGKVTITVTSLLDETKSASYELTVKEGVDVSALQATLAEARMHAESAYTADSYAKLADAVKAAEDLLTSGTYTKSDVENAKAAIEDAIDALVMRPLDEATLINADASSPAKVVAVSSQAAESPAEGALDYDEDTFWHSNYNGPTLPQYIVFDLGAEYDLTDVTFLPRQSGTNGDIFKAQVLVADTLEETAEGEGTWRLLGTFEFDNDGKTLTNRTSYQQMSFGAATARYVKINVLSAGGNSKDEYCSMAEARFYGAKHEEPQVVDKSALQGLFDEYTAKDLKAADYTEASWTPFELALSDAERLLADDDATQDEVTQCAAALKAAFEGLVKTDVPPVEDPTRDQLTELVEKAGKVDTSGKTADSVAALKNAIAYAEQVLADEASTPEQLKAAYDQLKLAIEGLKDEGSEPVDPDKPTDPDQPTDPSKPGTGDEGQGGSDQGGSGNTGKPGTSGKPGQGNLPRTGDVSGAAVAAAAVAGTAAVAVGAIAWDKNRKRSE